MKKLMIVLSAAIALMVISCEKQQQAPVVESYKAEKAAMIERGKYLVTAMGCDDCHSPKRMGPNGVEIIQALRFSGYPSNAPVQEIDRENLQKGWVLFAGDLTSSVGPWGQSFSANITSDATGIGNWSEENFLTAIKKGKYKGIESGRDLLPPMPWFAYKNLTDEDLKSIFAFLQTTNPVQNVVPAPIAPSDLK